MSIAKHQFCFFHHRGVIPQVKTVYETRIERLNLLVKKHGDSLAVLNDALGLVRTDSTLSQIRTKAPNSKTGKPRGMGDVLARKIEEKLGLPEGWMDTPLSYAEMRGDDDPRSKALAVFEALPDYQVDTALRLLAALTESKKSTGTGGE